jgi:pimeloyl-ACP methyl ester carboxylesterase
MSKPPARSKLAALRVRDLHGLTRLGLDATVAVTHLVEQLHHSIASGAGLLGPGPSGPSRGISGLVYRLVRDSTRVAGLGVDRLMDGLSQVIAPGASNPEREAVLAALCGIWGDHLHATHNPLAIEMAFRMNGQALALKRAALRQRMPIPQGRILLLLHGLCMNDLQWLRQGHDHGMELAQAQGLTPIYLHYNSGQHISHNGRALSEALDTLLVEWPVPPQELVLLGHSMGGLVARSACHHAAITQAPWLARLGKLICLGSPHHGAPLERGGRLLDSLLDKSPYLAPFARLGRARSAGISDLGFGNLQDGDWQAQAQAPHQDTRLPTPLPVGVPTYLVAALQAQNRDPARNALIGDGLVPLASALGEHTDPARTLPVPDQHKRVVTGANHWDLLNHPQVSQQLQRWLAA